MSVVLATYNIKGGVGKTSAAANLAYLAAREGAPTLLWDLDPQGASTYLFRVKPKTPGGPRKLVRGRTDIAAVIKGTDHAGLDLLPADFRYRHMDLALDSVKKPMRRLARVLKPLREDYRYLFLDCPPSISLVSENIFDAADVLLVPIIPATLASRTLEQLVPLLEPDTQLLAFFSMVDGRKRLHREVMESLREAHPGVLDATVPTSAVVERMGVRRDVLESFAPRSRAAGAYRELWREVRQRLSNAESTN